MSLVSIMLDKNPGLRPIGVGEVLQTMLAKAVAWVTNGGVKEGAEIIWQEGG